MSNWRRGSAYFLMLSLCLLVSILCLGSVLVGRSQLRRVVVENDTADARAYAQAAIELGRWMMLNDPAWRTTHKNDPDGNWFVARPVGRGTCTLTVVNPNGALDRANTDTVILSGTGSAGGATQIVSVTLAAVPKPLTCLAAGMTSGSNFDFGKVTLQPQNTVVACNGTADGSDAKVYANVEAGGTITGKTYYGQNTPNVTTARGLPDARVFDFYKDNGTAINVASLPSVDGTPGFNKILLSPANNPYGATNASGIYVIDCGGQSFTLSDSRIVATLVLLNCPTMIVKDAVHWTPAVANYPALLVQGNLSINLKSGYLGDESGIPFNQNPAGTPYPWPNGLTDATYTTNCPSSLSGLMYATGTLTTAGTTIAGMLVAGGSTLHSADLTVIYDPSLSANPPPGFCSFVMTPLANGFRRTLR